MTRNRRVSLAKIAVTIAILPVLIYAYSEGPDAGLAGVPGESTCASCHRGSGGAGSVQVAFPAGLSYTPGVKQHLLVSITDPAQRRWGFELTARLATGNSTMAGGFTPSDGKTQLVCTQTNFRSETFGNSCANPAALPLQYIEQTLAGTQTGVRNSASFEFDWTPPAKDAGSVVIYVAGNAADGDGSERNDHIYTAKYTLTAAAPVTANPPVIAAVVNGAGYQNSIASGAWVTIGGTNLANTARSWRPDEIVNHQLPVSLDGVSVTINNKPAFLNYISGTLINVQAPTDSAVGPVSVQVTNNGAVSNPATVDLEPFSPAFFLWEGKYAAATTHDFTPATSAKPGETIILWGSGFGSVSPGVPAGFECPSDQTYSVATNPVVLIGGVPAQLLGAALTPGNAGLYQVAVQVPAGLSNGDQSVSVTVNGVQSPGGVYLNVHD